MAFLSLLSLPPLLLFEVLYESFMIQMIQSYPPMTLDRRLQEDWARDAGEDPRVLMSFRVDFGPMG